MIVKPRYNVEFPSWWNLNKTAYHVFLYASEWVWKQRNVCMLWYCFHAPVPSSLFSDPTSDGFSVQSVKGMLYNPASGAWSWTNSTAINYALHAVKVRDDLQPEAAEVGEGHSASTHSWDEAVQRAKKTPRKQSMWSNVEKWGYWWKLNGLELESEMFDCCRGATDSLRRVWCLMSCKLAASVKPSVSELRNKSHIHHFRYALDWIFNILARILCDLLCPPPKRLCLKSKSATV